MNEQLALGSVDSDERHTSQLMPMDLRDVLTILRLVRT